MAGCYVTDPPRRFGTQDNGVRAVAVTRGAIVREFTGSDAAVPRRPDPEVARRPAPHPTQRVSGLSAAVSQVEHPEATGPADRAASLASGRQNGVIPMIKSSHVQQT